MGTIFGRNPAVILGLVGSLIALAVGFGLDISTEQTGLIMAAVSALIGVITRSQVWSPASVENILSGENPKKLPKHALGEPMDRMD